MEQSTYKRVESRIERPSVEDLVGDSGVFVKVYDAYQPWVYSYIACRVNSIEDAEDLTSRTFEKALRNLRSYNPEKSGISTWLFKIAGNVTIDYYRREATRKKVDLESLYRMYQGDLTDKEDMRRLEVLVSAIRDLSDSHQKVLNLKYMQGMSNDEVANILGCNKNTLSMKIYRSLKALRKHLEAAGVEIDTGSKRQAWK